MEIKDKLYVKKGDLLVCARNGSKQLIGKNAYIDKDYNYSFGAFMSVFRSDYNEYIYQLFQTDMYKKQIQANLGATINQITTKDINSFQFPFPKNIKEQQKIASILSTWDKAIELKEKLIEQKKEQKKGLMQKLLTGEVRLPGFQGKWRKVKIKDLSKVVTGTTPSTSNKTYYQDGVYPWITPTDINESKYIASSERNLTKIGLEKGRFVPAGSLLITCIASIGKNAILTKDGSCNQQINAILPSANHSNEFLYYRLSMDTQRLETLAGKSATAIINKNSFENFQIDIPTFAEQLAIAKVLSQIDQFIELAITELEMLKQQKKGLMQLLLTGKVRVKV